MTGDTQADICARETEDGLLLDVQVQPRASRDKVGPVMGDRLKVAVTAPAVDGAANQALADVLARAFGVARGAVTLVRGHTGRRKTVHIQGVRRALLDALLADQRR